MSITTTALCWRSLRCEGMGCSHCCRTAAGGPIGQRLGPDEMPDRSRCEARWDPRPWNITAPRARPPPAPPATRPAPPPPRPPPAPARPASPAEPRDCARPHRAVHDHAGVVPGTPPNLVSRGLAPDQGEGRLQRIHVADRFAPLEQRDVEVRDARGPHFAFLDESHHRVPGVLHGRPRLVGPVKLIEVDALDAEPPERRLALLSDGIWAQHPPRFLHAVALVPHQPALGEHEWPVAGWQFR